MNPPAHIEDHENRLGPETEDFYSNKLFRSLDCVVNALDNVEAREYAASRIEFNGCPMVDSGTMGPQASQQVIIPNYTKSYKAQKAQENSFPICTLKNFPYQIEHTIQWAKDLFMTCFTNTPKLVNMYTKVTYLSHQCSETNSKTEKNYRRYVEQHKEQCGIVNNHNS